MKFLEYDIENIGEFANAGHIYPVLLHYLDGIAREIDARDYRPLFITDATGGFYDLSTLKAWAQGFWLGMHLAPREWDFLKDPEPAGKLLEPILYFATYRDGKNVIYTTTHSRVSTLTDAAEKFPSIIREIRNFWHNRRPRSTTRATPKASRNEPCPCGSGIKYKRCCGMYRS